MTFAAAQDIEAFMAKISDERPFNVNPCEGIEEYSFVLNTRGCSWYHVCNNVSEVIGQGRCPSGFYFNAVQQICDHRENVNCDWDDRWTNLVCPNDPGITVIPHTYSCSKYTICFDGLQNDRDCPQGLQFSYYDNDCVDPFLADCNLDYFLCQEAVQTGIAVFIPNSRDCRSYFVCVGDTSVELRCAPTQHFLPGPNWCVSEEEANCQATIPEENPNIPDTIFIDCQGATGVTLPHPESCSFYFFCAGDRSYLQVCGFGLIFDTITGRCQDPDDATCILDIDPTTEPTDAPSETPPPEILQGLRAFIKTIRN